jgi:Ni,Fe-hydrogenase III component G
MTTLENLLDAAKTRLARWQSTFTTPAGNRLDVALPPDELLDAAALLQGWSYLVAITGLDGRDALEILYHFGADAAIITLRVRLPRAGGSLPSVCANIPAASMFEREISEMFGIAFTGAPDTSRLFLPDDWTEGVYPLLKDARLPGGKES